MKLTVGKKIVLGFSGLLTLAIVLGVVAVVQMHSVEEGAESLSVAYVPEVQMATAVERESLLTLWAIRGYAYTHEEKFLKDGQAALVRVYAALDACKDLAQKQNLKLLSENEAKARKAVKEYEDLLKEAVQVDAVMDKVLEKATVAANVFVNNVETYQSAQADMLKDLLKKGDSDGFKEKVADRAEKLQEMNEILSCGNEIRIANFKAQALRSPKVMEEGMQRLDSILLGVKRLRSITSQDSNLRQLDAIESSAKAYVAAMGEYLAAWKKNEALAAKRTEIGLAVIKYAQETSSAAVIETMHIADQSSKDLFTARSVMTAGLVIALAIGLSMAYVITRSITKPLSKAIEQLSAGANQTASASAQVSGASQSLAEGASEQASSLEETSSSLEEMASMTKRNAENANTASRLAAEARSAADVGSKEMLEMAKAMEAIRQSSADISKIIKTIDEIAFQTNILALNAAVEAARAGEAGSGFAVVADEVRSLAQRSAVAARETAEKIEDAVQKSVQGVEISARVSTSLDNIVIRAREVDKLISEIASASHEQDSGIHQINQAVTQMDQVTQGNAANAEQTASASEELSAQAEELNQIVLTLSDMVGVSIQQNAAPTQRREPKVLKASNQSIERNAPKAALTEGKRSRSADPDFKDF